MNTTDLDATVEFYRDVLGAELIARYEPPGLAFFDFAGVRVMFEAGTSSSVLYLWVDDIDAAAAELEAKNVTIVAPPHVVFDDAAGTFGRAGEAEWMAFFEDPSGNTLALATRK